MFNHELINAFLVASTCCAVPCWSQTNPMTCVESTVTVYVDRDWQEVSPNVTVGDLLEFSAAGSWNYLKGPNRSKVGPDGFIPITAEAAPYQSQFALPTATISALIAKIGSGTPFLVGSSRALSSPRAGPVHMRMNDLNWEDNDGSVQVRFRICRNA